MPSPKPIVHGCHPGPPGLRCSSKGPAQLKPGRGHWKTGLPPLIQGGLSFHKCSPPQLPHPSHYPDMGEFTVPGLGPHKDPHQSLLGLPRQQEGSRSAGTCCPSVLPGHPAFTPGSPALLKPSPHLGHTPFPLLSPTSPSKLVVPILGCTVNHPGHLFKNPSALVAHRTNSIRMSGARSQASAFEKNPK